MKRNFLILFFAIYALSIFTAKADSYTYQVNPKEITNGYITRQIWLTQYVMPQITISGIEYKDSVALPAHATAGDATDVQIKLGMMDKRPFATIFIPAFATDNNTHLTRRVTNFKAEVTEPLRTLDEVNAKTTKTTAANSVLATGTWYKIATPATGLVKVDGNLLKSMGIDITNLSSAHIRLFGNGGNMLSQTVSVPRPSDLVENAIAMYDGGDGVFNQNDYFIFYAVGPTAWNKDSTNKRFVHLNNLYADSAYYFITVDQGDGLRIGTQNNVPTGNETVTSFNDYASHELDLVNPGEIGKEWYGEAFGENPGQTTSQSFNFSFGTVADSVYCSVQVASASSSGGNVFTITANGQAVGSVNYGGNINADETDPVFENAPLTKALAINSASVSVNINYQPGNSTATGYLNAIELNLRRPLAITTAQQSFRDWNSVGAGKVATYQLQGANTNTQVWDITDRQVPVIMHGNLSGSTYSFTQDAAMLHEFVALNDASQLSIPTYVGQVANQNLHSLPQADLIIVTNPSFVPAAEQLSTFHQQHDNLRTVIVTTAQIYNEFSSGGQDISAIRDFAKMFYDRAGSDTAQAPKYLLMFGGASYDYKNRVPNNSNFVPTFESANSHDNINSFCTDDFFGFLDDNEDIENTSVINTLDLGVGRLPARNETDALAMVNKIITYKSPASLGPWRISSTFVADNDDDAGNHMQDAEAMAYTVDSSSKDLYNQAKVYIDATPTIITPAGPRCPNANAAIDDQVFKGTFLINYNGHGNTEVWASERILTQDDYNQWNNPNMLPFTVTATCDFGQFDHPEYVSAGEQLVVRNTGGVIAAVTTTQAVYAQSNHKINDQYLTEQFMHLPNGSWNSFGTSYRLGKNITYQTNDQGDLINFRKFSLLGDPALVPDFPQYSIRTDSVNMVNKDNTIGAASDTLKGLGAYQVSGSVTDANNTVLNDFNGTISVTLYDKPRTVQAITNPAMTYQIQDNIIYRGKASVTNGHFTYSFITPKDINYDFGHGKVSSYADNGSTDASGADTSFTVGGLSDNPVTSTTVPVVKPYIGDSLFINGGITGPNTSLFVSLYDDLGINVSGTEVGHDLTAVLDGNTASPYILNDYYESAPNTYKQGYVNFPISGLATGPHALTIRAWDVNNNYADATVNFMVMDSSGMTVQGLMNYPNPFKDETHFVFEHNHPNEELHVQLYIYNTAGARVRILKQDFMPASSRSNEIVWDGTDETGVKLPSGVYIYRINIATDSGIQATAYQKLVLIR